MLDRLLVSGPQALDIVLGTTGIYLTFVVLLRLFGQRLISGFSVFDLAAAMALGAIVGRTALGDTPVLAGGVLALLTLATLVVLFGAVRSTTLGARLITPAAVLVMADGRLLPEQMRRAHVVTEELHVRLRLAGVRSYDEVAAMVLEPGGALSVIRRGEQIDATLLAGVRGVEALPADLLAPVTPTGPPPRATPSPGRPAPR